VSFGTLLGCIVGFSLLFGAIFAGTNNYLSFVNLEGFLIVVGGALANAFMSYQANYVVLSLKAVFHMFQKPKATHATLNLEMKRLIRWASLSQKNGIKWLEDNTLPKVREPFMRYGIELVISGYKPEEVRTMMDTAVEAAFERNMVPVTVLKNMAGSAPAFGMVGTLVGMVIMMGNLQADMSQIGKGLGISLLATLYGVVTARLVYLPAAEKLQQKEEQMKFRNYLITEGLVMLAGKHSPRYVQDKLNSFIDPSIVDNWLDKHDVAQETQAE
jgi:chemotaxis protein MotA